MQSRGFAAALAMKQLEEQNSAGGCLVLAGLAMVNMTFGITYGPVRKRQAVTLGRSLLIHTFSDRYPLPSGNTCRLMCSTSVR